MDYADGGDVHMKIKSREACDFVTTPAKRRSAMGLCGFQSARCAKVFLVRVASSRFKVVARCTYSEIHRIAGRASAGGDRGKSSSLVLGR